MKTGHGPGNIRIKKVFPVFEERRCRLECSKMTHLYEIGKSSGLFNVPKVLALKNNSYEIEYIKGVVELNETGYLNPLAKIRDRLLDIVDAISSHYKTEDFPNLWKNMLYKFNQLETTNEEYNTLIKQLPEKIVFNEKCIGYSHGDLTFDNILVNPNTDQWSLIDPSWSEVESPLWDVGKIMQTVLVGWNTIKRTGKLDYKDGWISQLCYSGSYHASGSLVDCMVKKYGYDAVVLSTACQLARVSRWCFADVLIPVINELLKRYFSGSEVDFKAIELPSIIERMLA